MNEPINICKTQSNPPLWKRGLPSPAVLVGSSSIPVRGSTWFCFPPGDVSAFLAGIEMSREDFRLHSRSPPTSWSSHIEILKYLYNYWNKYNKITLTVDLKLKPGKGNAQGLEARRGPPSGQQERGPSPHCPGAPQTCAAQDALTAPWGSMWALGGWGFNILLGSGDLGLSKAGSACGAVKGS